MFQINFTQDAIPAFRHGFIKGLAAPVGLFAVAEAPRIPVVEPVPLPDRSDREALAGDWRRVGGDLRTALARYAEAA